MSPDDPESPAAARYRDRKRQQKSLSRTKPTLDVQPRRCLGPCGRMFKSSWIGNRLCHNCTNTAAWKRSAIA